MFYEKMLAESKRLGDEIEATKELIATFPEGSLSSSKNGKYYKWYQKVGKVKKHISQEERSFAEKMAVKKFYSLKLKSMMREKKAIDSYLKWHDTSPDPAEELLADTSNYKDLLAPYFTSFSKELLDWSNSPYERNTKNPETLTHKTVKGLLVRSKGEAMIAKMLYMNKIPFRYECALQLPGQTIFPDFTIRHPKTGRVIYWEHFGMMDKQRYCEHACFRFETYVKNGLIPSIHVIITYETKDNPLSIVEIDDTIQKYFL